MRSAKQRAWNRMITESIAGDVADAHAKHVESVSWWCGLNRQDFYREAAKRQVQIAAARIAASVKSPIVGWKGSA